MVSSLGGTTKVDKYWNNNQGANDEPMTVEADQPPTGSSSQATSGDLLTLDNGIQQQGGEDAAEEDSELLNVVWQRDPERERDKILGFFIIGDQPVPRDIFHLIMSFIPAYPFYFMLRSVCSQWLYEFQEQIYGNVTYLSLVDDGRPKYYFRKGDDGRDQLVQFKPIDATGKACRLSDSGFKIRNYNRTPVFEFLANVFPNVKHLRLPFASFLDPSNFNNCVKTILPKLTQLETLDVLGTSQAYLKRHYWRHESSMNELTFEVIARSLPSSTKNLNFIGAYLNLHYGTNVLKIFSKKGRLMTTDLNILRSSPFNNWNWMPPITVDIQHFTLPYVCFNSTYSFYQPDGNWDSIKELYSHFDVSVVGLNNYLPTLQAPVVSYVDYMKHMSLKEGIFLSHMEPFVSQDTDEVMEATIDIAVREYPYFRPLLSLPASETDVLLAAYTKLDASLVYNKASIGLKAVELLTDPDRMKFPELVMGIDSTFYQHTRLSTVLGTLISQCSTEEEVTLIKAIIEDYQASMTVTGVRNYLVELMISRPSSAIRTSLMKYLLSIKPDLIVLGDSEGIINNDQKDLPLIQLVLTGKYASDCLSAVRYFATEGASLTQVDKDKNNVLHSVSRFVQSSLLSYLFTMCPENLMYERNNQGQTPLEQIFLPNCYHRNLDINVLIEFLNQVSKLPCFKDQTLQSYPTSCGNLLHVAMTSPHIQTIQWLLKNNFDANALNDRGENALFYSKTSIINHYASHSMSRSKSIINQEDYVDDHAAELIRAGAKVDIENNIGETVVIAALRNKNYLLINNIIQQPSISSKPLSTLLAPRTQHGFNALHFLFRKMADVTDSLPSMGKKQTSFRLGDYPVAKHCALLCLEHYPEMLYERSGPSDENTLKDISGISPLQILLEASQGLFLLNELSIKLSDIANMPVFSSKDANVVAPIPVLYLALEVAIDIPMFDKLMNYTNDLLVRDKTQETKPNLLHIAAERDASLCQCIIKHWKKRYNSKEELSKLISMPLENDSADGRKPRNAALIACMLGSYEIFSILWPLTKVFSSQFDNPVQIALGRQDHTFALSAVMHHGVIPSKPQLHQIIRKRLVQNRVDAVHESKFVSLLIQTEEEQPKPSWLEMLTQTPSEASDPEEERDIQSLSTLQLVVSTVTSYMFSWLVRHYSDDPLLDHALRLSDPRTGNTLLHMLTNGTHSGLVSQDLSSILLSIVDRFKVEGVAPKQTKRRSKTKLPSLDHLNTKDLTEFINIKNNLGRTCLHNVAVNSTQWILFDLLIFGASLEIKDSDGKTPLELMSSASATEIVQKFLDMKDGKKPQKKRKVEQKKKAEARSDDSNDEDNDDDADYGSTRRKRRRTTRK